MASLLEQPERLVRWFDARQRDRWWLAFPLGVVRKYADDRGSAFAALVTYQVFLGMLPLLVVALTILGRVLEASDDLRASALESTLGQLPLVGERLRDDVSTLSADGLLLAVSAAGLLWTATGIHNGLQLALNQVWNVEGVHRQGFVSRLLRAVLLFVLVFAAAIGTAVVGGENLLAFLPSGVADVVAGLARVALSTAILLAVFRIAVAPVVPLTRLLPAALLAGLFWQLLQRIGVWLVADRLTRAGELYGTLGVVVVALFWINLLARSAVFANEWAVVGWRRLWPRRIAQPPLTEADQRVLVGLAGNERRRPEEHVEVGFDDEGTEDRDAAGEGDDDAAQGQGRATAHEGRPGVTRAEA